MITAMILPVVAVRWNVMCRMPLPSSGSSTKSALLAACMILVCCFDRDDGGKTSLGFQRTVRCYVPREVSLYSQMAMLGFQKPDPHCMTFLSFSVMQGSVSTGVTYSPHFSFLTCLTSL